MEYSTYIFAAYFIWLLLVIATGLDSVTSFMKAKRNYDDMKLGDEDN
jgi:hypothetical protein